MPAYTNAKTTVPQVFVEVMKNDREREALRDLFVSGGGTHDDWWRARELVLDRKNLRGSAERSLRWNTDKGAVG